jgi:hypothetical protein
MKNKAVGGDNDPHLQGIFNLDDIQTLTLLKDCSENDIDTSESTKEHTSQNWQLNKLAIKGRTENAIKRNGNYETSSNLLTCCPGAVKNPERSP